jgi:pyridinium-3,5-bisthiocarboxylic acid mononucleotide nickel chelatase
MKFIYFDASCGLSGDMILGALLDLGIEPSYFISGIQSLKLPVDIKIYETRRMSLRGLKVDVSIQRKNHLHRKWSDIKTLIEKSSFSADVKRMTLEIFHNLFKAEARVHGRNFESAHLHEAGADDAIIDILGACFLLKELKISQVLCSPLNMGSGWVHVEHGRLPVPPPAVGELLKGIPVYSAQAEHELVTPTGAAIISTAAVRFEKFPQLCYESVGYGAGSRDIPDFPNLLRVFYGDVKPAISRNIIQLEANIDDSSPQVLAGFMDKALQAGALDVFLTPVVMKKNRLASKLTLLAEKHKIEALAGLVFRETSSIGIRYFPVERQVLKRDLITVKILGETLSIKVSSYQGEETHAQPEFSDCLRVAEKTGIPLKKVMQLALHEYMTKQGESSGSQEN